jgi:hypothetical protein
VIHDNVVPFDPRARGGMARRGAPDKIGIFPVEAVPLQCPSCSCELLLAAESMDGQAELLCARCDTGIRIGARREGGAG